jgi:hypothetical protein
LFTVTIDFIICGDININYLVDIDKKANPYPHTYIYIKFLFKSEHLKKYSILSDEQFGFRADSSTGDAPYNSPVFSPGPVVVSYLY